MIDKKWKRMTGEHVTDFKAVLKADIKRNIEMYGDVKFYVGVDSQVVNDKIQYVSAIAMRVPRHGACAYYFTEILKWKKHSYREKLWTEVYKAVDLAKWLDDFLVDYDLCVEEIHADLNPSEKHLSNSVMAGCLGYIKSSGYTGVCKPNAWCASNVANRKSK